MQSSTSIVLRHVATAAVAASLALGCVGCTSGKGSSATGTTSAAVATSLPPAGAASAAPPTNSKPTPVKKATTPPPAPASVHANELGKIPVMMYHKLVAHPTSDYERTPTAFVKDLTWFEKNHFYPVTAANFVAGRINIPAGMHAVVFTFDDGTVSQFELGADGTPRPGTALALMQTFAKSHPDFPAIATFYVNTAPFGTKAGEKALAYLTAHGCEVGVHTVDHPSLSSESDAKVQQEIADNYAMIRKADPAQQISTMALPFGNRPKVHALAETGSADGTSYALAGVFAVGSNASHSPYNAGFNPFYVPRIRAEDVADAKGNDKQFVSGFELPQLVANPSTLYTSDGDPKHVSYPKGTTVPVAAKWKSEAQPY